MYIARIHIQNFRCFDDTTVEFKPGLNIIIGENNAGKTTLLRALALVFGRRGRSRPGLYDFCRLRDKQEGAPKITIAVTIRSCSEDTAADRALVASWLTKLSDDWEAQLTYSFFLPEQHMEEYAAAEDEAKAEAKRKAGPDAEPEANDPWELLEEFLPKYVSKVYAGNPETVVVADSESLAKFDCQILDALRDVDSEMFAGTNPLLRSMLEHVLDFGVNPNKRRALRRDFLAGSDALRENLVGRLDTKRLFELVTATGAGDAGKPKLQGSMKEEDLLAALRLFIEREGLTFPVTHNGLGYNNLLYISLVLASLASRVSEEKLGQNAAVFPMLLIEEPEAHLHPALQYKLLSHLAHRVDGEPHLNRQIFLTTHSTHITAAAKLEQIVCLSIRVDGTIGVAYPERVFEETASGKESCGYVERYLDATKSSMLFAKAIVFVEGIAEQILVPTFARVMNRSFDQHHVAVVRVDGLTFKHFLPLFGAGTCGTGKDFALQRRVACIVDGDPVRLEKAVKNPRWKACFPFELGLDKDRFDYRSSSHTAENLTQLADTENVRVNAGKKTLEYDIAFDNARSPAIVSDSMDHPDELRTFMNDPDASLDWMQTVLEPDEIDALDSVQDKQEQHRHRVAAVYLRSVEAAKGEHAFVLDQVLRETGDGDTAIKCPDYIREAIEWVTPAVDSGDKLP